MTVDDDNRANGLSLDEETLQSEIANILALPEPSRIEIVNSVCHEKDATAGATVMIDSTSCRCMCSLHLLQQKKQSRGGSCLFIVGSDFFLVR
jgi:hypothetical protein